MAWQLIYTSAPRLLEAGRTGFGTVARHRAVSGMLAASVERFSQFARLPGHDPRRIVHTHRILILGSSTYHVLSCLQDAGSDYTGRTNHIAHHLIAEPREIRALASAGLTPADVLLAMPWRSSWSEGPRYLDPSEEINLASFTPSASNAWASVTGNPASAGILWSREALKGCYLITPPGINTLELFRESLLVEPSQAWQTRFTTCLEPNDDVADFRWVALTSASPMRTQVETTSRLVLDLTAPATLPEPPKKQAPPPLIETVNHGTPAPAHPMVASVPAPLPSSPAAPAPISSMGSWSPEPRRKAAKSNRSFIGISLIIASIMIVVVLGALLRQRNLKVQARAEYEQKIDSTWQNHQLILSETRRLLEEQTDLGEGEALLKSHENFFRGMQQALQQPGSPTELPLPAQTQDDLEDLKKRLAEWTALHVNPWADLQSGQATVTAQGILEAYHKWQQSRTSTWNRLSTFLSLKDLPPPGEDVLQSLMTAARDALRSAKPAHDSRPSWAKVFALPGAPQNSSALEALQWLKLWGELENPVASSDAAAQTAASDASLPEWLRAWVAEKKQPHTSKNAPRMAVKTDDKPAQKAPEPAIVIEDADAVSATNGIYLYLLQPSEEPAGKIDGLQVSPDMQLFVGTAWERHPPPDGKPQPKEGELKKWMGVSSDDSEKLKFSPTLLAQLTQMIAFSKDGMLTAFPEELRKSPDGVRIVARSKDGVKVLFDLRLIPISSASSRPMLTQAIESTVINAAAVTLKLPPGFLSRLHFVGQQELRYALRHDGPANQKKFFTLKSTGDSSFQVIPPVIQNGSVVSRKEIENKIKVLEAGIAKDIEYLAENESSKESLKIKTEKRDRYEKSKAEKENQLQALQTQLQSLEGNAPPHFDLLPGNFILALEQPNQIELCRLNVVPPASPSPLKLTNP
ncbi:hypothetical protein [Prosthecobacter fluviatilis]|uniref:GTPase-associated protein 1 N-terminal domain-containing protein n=1 Tax=Prosthecobacter fluviatilis TaxID=445931 RepID=A0ABW0KQA8_9BACT